LPHRPAQGASDAHDKDGYLAALERLAAALGEASAAVGELARAADIQLAAGRERALMGPVEANPTAPRFLTANDVAAILQVDAKTVRRWRSEGKLPRALVVGGIVRWPEETIRAWVAERMEAGR